MMSLKIDDDINSWLISLGVLKPSKNDKPKVNQKQELDTATSKQFMDGFKVAQLLKIIVSSRMAENKNSEVFLFISISSRRFLFFPPSRKSTLREPGFTTGT
jgi:hypothetical protein